MNPRTLRILSAAAVLALVLAWWLGRDPGGAGGGDGAASGALLEGYRARLNDVSRLELDDGKEPLRVEKRDGKWVDPARGGYPVKGEEVRRLLMALNALERREAKTARPELHGELQLAVPGDEETRGKVLRLWVGGEEQPAWEVVLGKTKWSPVRGLYARLLAEDQCWFAAGDLQLPYSPTAWFEKEVVNVNQLDVARIVLVRGAETFTLTRPDSDTPWTLAELPEGRALKSGNPFGSLANTLGYLNFDDVAPEGDARFARDPDLAAEFTCFNGAVVKLTGWKEGEETWLRFAAEPPPAPAEGEAEGAAGAEAGAEGEAGAEPGAEQPAVPADDIEGPQEGPRGPSAETIAKWNAGFQGWVFEVSAWKATALAQPLEDWLEPLPAAEEPPAEEPPQEDAPPGEDPPPPDDEEPK